MQLENLNVFCDLVETESFTKAAQINGVTQSAVSQTISTLERNLKSLLIERSRKNLRLTAEGKVLYDFSKRILQTFEDLQSKVQDLRQEISGEIRIATVYSIGLHDLPPYIKRFLKDHPTVNLHVEYRREDEVYGDVIGNLVDLGLVAYPSRDSKVEVVHLREDPLVLICHPQDPLAKLDPLKFKGLNRQKFISFAPELPTRKALDRMFKDHSVSVEHVMEFDNIETLKRVVEMGSGVAIVPEITVRQEVASRTLAAIKLDGKHVRQLGAIYKKGKVLSPAMKAFVKLLKQTL